MSSYNPKKDDWLPLPFWLLVVMAIIVLFAVIKKSQGQEYVKLCTILQIPVEQYEVFYIIGNEQAVSYTAGSGICHYFDMEPGWLTVWVDGSELTMVWIGRKNPWTGIYECISHSIVSEGEIVIERILSSPIRELPGYNIIWEYDDYFILPVRDDTLRTPVGSTK